MDRTWTGLKGKITFGRPRCKWNVKIDLKKVERGMVRCGTRDGLLSSRQ